MDLMSISCFYKKKKFNNGFPFQLVAEYFDDSNPPTCGDALWTLRVARNTRARFGDIGKSTPALFRLVQPLSHLCTV